jgi:tetratricopeptide (TPR) repeat protein
VALLLDDVHLADTESAALVVQVARLAGRHPLAVIAAHRSGIRLGAPFALVEVRTRSSGSAPPEIPTPLAEALRPIALLGSRFDVLEAGAATGGAPAEVDAVLHEAQAAGLIERTGSAYRFVEPAVAARLEEQLPPPERTRARARMAERLAAAGAPPGRVALAWQAAGDAGAAAGPALEAARLAAASSFHNEVLRWTELARGHLQGADESERLVLRADALSASGDSGAVVTYRQALAVAPAGAARTLRAKLARAAMFDGDLASAREALDGVELDGGPEDGIVLLARGMLAYFSGDLAGAESAVDEARVLALEPGAPDRLLDVITLQGMIAHSRGEWFDRLRRELRATHDNPRLASVVFDSHLCVAEYLLYGPTPYDEVVALAHELRRRAEEIGARRAVAFAITVAGEAALLAGDLDTARDDLTEAIELHRASGGDTGVAHALQRLAEVELAAGERATAERLLRRAVPLARWSPLARHLLQRIYGTLINAAPDSTAAVAIVDEAMLVLDEPASCPFCQVMVAVPAAIASAQAGRLDGARAFLAQAEMSAALWHGTSWQAAIEEARAVLAAAEGDEVAADRLFARAADLYEAAGQPLDAARCVEGRI